MSDCCLMPNEQYEELDISKNSGKPYKNTNFDKEVIHVITEYYDKWRQLWIIYFILDTKISEESVFRQVYSSTCLTKELSITMTKFCMQWKEDNYHTVTKYIHVVTSIKRMA